MEITNITFDKEHFICIYQNADDELFEPVAFYNLNTGLIDWIKEVTFPLQDCYFCGRNREFINKKPHTIENADEVVLSVIYNEYQWYLLKYCHDSIKDSYVLIDENSRVILSLENAERYIEDIRDSIVRIKAYTGDKINRGYYGYNALIDYKTYIINFKQHLYKIVYPVLNTTQSFDDYYRIIEIYDSSHHFIGRNIAYCPFGTNELEWSFLFPNNNYLSIDALISEDGFDAHAVNDHGETWLLYEDLKHNGEYQVFNLGCDCYVERLCKTYGNMTERLHVKILSVNGKKKLLWHGNKVGDIESDSILYLHTDSMRDSWEHEKIKRFVSPQMDELCFCLDNRIFTTREELFSLKQGTIVDTWNNFIAYKHDNNYLFMEIYKVRENGRKGFRLAFADVKSVEFTKDNCTYLRLAPNEDRRRYSWFVHLGTFCFDPSTEKFILTSGFEIEQKVPKDNSYSDNVRHDTLNDVFEGEVELYSEWLDN